MHKSANNKRFEPEVPIKVYLRTYRWPILLSILTLVLSIVLFQGWQQSKHQRMEKAALLFEQMLQNTQLQKLGASKEKSAAMKQASLLANTLVQLYANTPYAILANLTLAKIAISHHDLQAAEQALDGALKGTHTPELITLIKIRKARLLIEKKDYQSAQALLVTIDHPRQFLPMVTLLNKYISEQRSPQSDDAMQNSKKVLKKGLPLESLFQPTT